MAERFCQNCGSPISGDVCDSCGSNFAVDRPTILPGSSAVDREADPLLQGYVAQLDMARQMGASEDKLQVMLGILEEMTQLRKESPDDASFIMSLQGTGLVQKYASAASDAMISGKMGEN